MCSITRGRAALLTSTCTRSKSSPPQNDITNASHYHITKTKPDNGLANQLPGKQTLNSLCANICQPAELPQEKKKPCDEQGSFRNFYQGQSPTATIATGTRQQRLAQIRATSTAIGIITEISAGRRLFLTFLISVSHVRIQTSSKGVLNLPGKRGC